MSGAPSTRIRDVDLAHLLRDATVAKLNTARDALHPTLDCPKMPARQPVIVGRGSWPEGAKTISSGGRLHDAGQSAVEALIGTYAASTASAEKQVALFAAFLRGRPCSEELFKEYVEPLQRRVKNKTLDASSLATYMGYVSNRYRMLKTTKLFKAVKAQGGHLGGSKRAPRVPPTLKKKLLAYVRSVPITTIKAGMWLQMRIGAPRCCDVSRIRTGSFMQQRGKAHWNFTKSIRDAANCKTTPILKKEWVPPFTSKWWTEQGELYRGQPLRNYDSALVNAEMRKICVDHMPMPTSTSLRLVMVDDTLAETGNDYEEAARYTVHKTGQILSAAYDAPRRIAVRQR